MDDASLSQVMRTGHLKSLRSHLLLLLNKAYPQFQHSDVLYWGLTHEVHFGTCLNEVVCELQYLSEKDLVRIELIVEGRYLATITARGRDFLEGTIQVDGLCELTARMDS